MVHEGPDLGLKIEIKITLKKKKLIEISSSGTRRTIYLRQITKFYLVGTGRKKTWLLKKEDPLMMPWFPSTRSTQVQKHSNKSKPISIHSITILKYKINSSSRKKSNLDFCFSLRQPYRWKQITTCLQIEDHYKIQSNSCPAILIEEALPMMIAPYRKTF